MLLAGAALLPPSIVCQEPQPSVSPAENPGARKLLAVVTKDDPGVDVFDLSSMSRIARLPTGTNPHELAVSPDGRHVVAANYGDNTLSLIDLGGLVVVRTISLGDVSHPHGLAYVANDRVLVTLEDARAVALVDLGEGQIRRTISTDQEVTHMVIASDDGSRALTANIVSGTVTALDVDGGTLERSVAAGIHPEGIALVDGGRELWVASNEEDVIRVFNAVSLAPVTSIPTGSFPIRLAVSGDGKLVLASNFAANAVQVFDAGARELLATIPTGVPNSRPLGIVFDPDGETAYVSLRGARKVAVLDVFSGTVTDYLDTGAGPDGIGVALVPYD